MRALIGWRFPILGAIRCSMKNKPPISNIQKEQLKQSVKEKIKKVQQSINQEKFNENSFRKEWKLKNSSNNTVN